MESQDTSLKLVEAFGLGKLLKAVQSYRTLFKNKIKLYANLLNRTTVDLKILFIVLLEMLCLASSCTVTVTAHCADICVILNDVALRALLNSTYHGAAL